MAADARPEPDPDQAWKALSFVSDWVRHAETKIIATLAAAGVSAGLLYSLASGWEDASTIAVVLGYLDLVALVSTAWACGFGLVPRKTARPEDRGLFDIIDDWKVRAKRRYGRARGQISETDEAPPDEQVNLIFYSDITKAYGTSGPEYRDVLAALTLDPTRMTEHIAHQVWANATVAERKFNWANRAIVRLLTSWILLGTLAYLRVVWG